MTQTQTVRVPITSDVWVSTVTQLTVTGTQLATQYSFAPDQADTVTSVLTITNTPVSTSESNFPEYCVYRRLEESFNA